MASSVQNVIAALGSLETPIWIRLEGLENALNVLWSGPSGRKWSSRYLTTDHHTRLAVQNVRVQILSYKKASRSAPIVKRQPYRHHRREQWSITEAQDGQDFFTGLMTDHGGLGSSSVATAGVRIDEQAYTPRGFAPELRPLKETEDYG